MDHEKEKDIRLHKKKTTQRARSVFVLTIVIISVMTVHLFAVFHYILALEKDGQVIDAAGRNRMLSQRIALLATQIADGDYTVQEELQGAISLHDASLNAITKGGIAPGINEGQSLPVPPKTIDDSSIKAQKVWDEYKEIAETITKSANNSEDTSTIQATQQTLVEKAPAMLSANDALVKAFVQENEKKQLTLLVILFGFFIIDIGVIFYVFLIVQKIIKSLKTANQENQVINESLSHTENEVANRNQELQKQKRAMINVLEDLQADKEQIKAKEAQLVEAQKIARFGNFEWNIKTNEIYWSDEAFHIHGWKPTKDHKPKPLNEYMKAIHPHDRSDAEKSMKQSLEITTDNSHTYRVIWPDKSVHYIRVASKLIVDNDGKPQIQKGTFQDITEDKEKEMIIEQERVKDEAILRSIGDGVIFTDHNSRITLTNKAAAELLERTPQEMLGKKISDITGIANTKSKKISDEERPIMNALKYKTKESGQFYYRKKSGESLPVFLTVTPVVVNDKVIGAIEIFRDITHEIEVDRMKTEFISLASHQLRTPLSAMKWNLEMLLAGDVGKVSKDQKEMLGNIDVSNERMIALVNSLLNVSRIESGRIMIDPEPTDLKELVQGVQNEVENLYTAKKQTFIVSASDELPKIKLDPRLIRQVYMNLITNAIKYTPEGGEITVFISKKDNQIVSQVSDTGYGIPEKDKDKVFQKFYRGENITKIITDGNGLGMYLVKAIIESSKGKIWFKSKEGKGTTFWFSLPMSGMKAKKGEVTLDS